MCFCLYSHGFLTGNEFSQVVFIPEWWLLPRPPPTSVAITLPSTTIELNPVCKQCIISFIVVSSSAVLPILCSLRHRFTHMQFRLGHSFKYSTYLSTRALHCAGWDEKCGSTNTSFFDFYFKRFFISSQSEICVTLWAFARRNLQQTVGESSQGKTNFWLWINENRFK